ncbi:unnamed protein product [Prunus armeniaca]
MNSNCLRLAIDFILMSGTTNAKADTIHVNSGNHCFKLSPCGWKCSYKGLGPYLVIDDVGREPQRWKGEKVGKFPWWSLR